MELTKEEKNELLARWVGFEQRGTARVWYSPEKDVPWTNNPPDLYHSLDAQAKWIDPKLNDLLGDTGWIMDSSPWLAEKYGLYGCKLYRSQAIERRAATLANAKAEAVLALTGEGNERPR